MIDSLEAEGFGPLGGQVLQVLDCASAGCADRAAELRARTEAVIVGVDRAGALPALDPAPFDALLTTAAHAPAPWTGVAAARLEQRLATIEGIVGRAPIAASVAMQVLRMTGALPFDAAITLESLAYSALLGGAEFRAWRHYHPVSAATAPGAPMVAYDREGDLVTITLDQPQRRNALCAAMRDALFEALAAVADDPSMPGLVLQGRGACFSTGGDLAEFGSAQDLAMAHAVRSARSCARLLHRLCNRTAVHLHGACVGSGIEIAAAAGRRIGRAGTFFQLPELTMGLIPGAGGTVTLPRAIGRHRTASMLLTARRIDAATALDWGLLTELDGR
jgi:hypothetical protein